jgi:hypothetical protein
METNNRYYPSELKSGLQKSVRRGEWEKGVSIALELLNVQPSSLFRRLSVIAAEDVHPSLGGPVHIHCELMEKEMKAGGDVRLRMAKLVKFLADRPKDKNSAGLPGVACLLNEKEGLPEVDFNEMAMATKEKDWVKAMRIAEACLKNNEKRGVWTALTNMTDYKPFNIVEHVRAMRSRSSKGLYECDELVFIAACLFMIGGYEEVPFNYSDQDVEIPIGPVEIGWEAFDMHVGAGKMALGALVKRGFDYNELLWTWWYYESALVNQEVGEFYPMERKMRGFDGKEGQWKRWRPEVEKLVNWARANVSDRPRREFSGRR